MAEYDFRSLSPSDFERLACDVLNADLNLRLHAFPEGRDGGIDLREITESGFTTVAQCKHYLKSSPSAFMRAVKAETRKPALRTANRYIFVTSHPLTAARETQVATILGISPADVWGPGRINRVLGQHPQIEEQHFKLWLDSTPALSQIVNAALWQRTDARLNEVASQARYWVEIPAYARARDMLTNEGVCIVTGVGGVGKTYLAERLMLQALHDGWRVIDVSSDLSEAWAAARTSGRHFFYFDDFLGQAELRLDATDTAPDLLNFITYVRRNKDHKRLVMTTRDQVLTQAGQANSDRLHDLADEPARCALSIPTLDSAHRAEILMNHLYFSDLPASEREALAVDTRITTLVLHPAFNPRLIRLVTGQRLSDSTADDVVRQLTGLFANPARVWQATFNVLTDLAREIILTLATFPARSLPHKELKTLTAPDASASTWKATLRALEPTWIKIVGSGSGRAIAFANPGCRDYLLGLLDDDDIAEELVTTGLKRLEQLISLSQSAGLLTADSAIRTTAHRRHLANALLSHRAELATHVEQWWNEWAARTERALGLTLLRLCDTAALLRLYGAPENLAWFADNARTLIAGPQSSALPCVESLRLARQIHFMPFPSDAERDELASTLTIAALANANTLRDLDAYEVLPDALRTPTIHTTAARRAARILQGELETLANETVDPEVLRAAADDLTQRADWYGVQIDVELLLDLIDELS